MERNQLKLAFSHPFALTVSSSLGVKTFNLTIDAREIPFPDKINLHRKIGETIYSHLKNNSVVASKTETLLDKVVNQLKLENKIQEL